MSDRRLAVFAYGSLVDSASARQTLGRPVTLIRARLSGRRRRWTIARDNERWEKRFEPADPGEPFRWCLGLNLEPVPEMQMTEAETWPNGALIEITADELTRLATRELRYDALDVTTDAHVEGGGEHGFDTVHAFAAKPEHRHPTPPQRSVVIAAYLRAVEAAFAALGEGQLDLYRATTGPPPAPIVEALLVADEIPPGNPREW